MLAKTNNKIIYPELCYKIYGLCYKVHNELGRYCKEIQYPDALEQYFQTEKIIYHRELELTLDINPGQIKRNRVDFMVCNKILIDTKAKRIITREDYFQAKRYLIASGLKLLLIVNFQEKYLKPKRVLNPKTQEKIDYSPNSQISRFA